ncbi:hypothetical protein [Leucobacter sp.]
MTPTPDTPNPTPEERADEAIARIVADAMDDSWQDDEEYAHAPDEIVRRLREAGKLVAAPTENVRDPEMTDDSSPSLSGIPTEEQIERAHAINGVREMERAFVTSEWGTVVRKLDVIEMLRGLPATGLALGRVSTHDREISSNTNKSRRPSPRDCDESRRDEQAS